MKIKIIARAVIIDSKTNKVHTDEGLRILDGYFEDVKEVDENYDKDSLLQQYEKVYPELKGWEFEIIEE